jgi:hypothetical protein
MPRIKFPLKTLFSALALSGLANACAYSNYSAETGPETAHRFCLIGVSDPPRRRDLADRYPVRNRYHRQ